MEQIRVHVLLSMVCSFNSNSSLAKNYRIRPIKRTVRNELTPPIFLLSRELLEITFFKCFMKHSIMTSGIQCTSYYSTEHLK